MEMTTRSLRPPTDSVRWTAQAWGAAISLALAIMQFRLILLVLGSHYGASIAAAKGVVAGMPHWLVYQNRVLGPWIVEFLSRLTGNFEQAYVLFVIAAAAAAGWLVLETVRQRYGSAPGWGALFLFHVLFAALLNPPWLYAWDHCGLIIFILFVRFAMDGKDYRWFVGLFAVAAFNRESALYIALWMILDPLVKAALDRMAPRWPMLISGILCMEAGIILIRYLREFLLVREIGPEMFNMPDLANKPVHMKWTENLAFLHSTLTRFSLTFEILIPIFLIAVAMLAVGLALRDPRRYLALSAVHLALVASIMLVGVLQETRVMLELVPFLCIGIWAVREEFPLSFGLPLAVAAARARWRPSTHFSREVDGRDF
jgi:hypothetical protein